LTNTDDVFDSFEDAIRGRPNRDPWVIDDGRPVFQPDQELLAQLLAIPLGEGRGSESGRLAKGIDAWVSSELRRAGFGDDEVWPRLTKPRVLPRDLALYLDGLPARDQAAARAHALRNKRVAPADAKVLGRAYVKQVDVLIAQWSRGPELLVSTKSMISSFRNNLPNRFEEAYGDAKNLRGRYPLVAMGFLFLLRSTVTAESGTLDRAIDMLQKLQQENDAYDASCLIVAEWADPPEFDGVRIRDDLAPADLSPGRFIGVLTAAVLTRTPVDMHVEVREKQLHRDLPLTEVDEAAGPTT
jgi:hypothetical protein